MSVYISTEQFHVTANVGSPPGAGRAASSDYLDLGTFSNFTGGDMDSEPQVIHPGGMLPAVVTGSRRTPGDVTIQRPFKYGDAAIIYHLINRVGRSSVTITKQPLDSDGHAFGAGFVFSGILKTVTHPEHDAESTDRAPWSLTITPDGTLGVV